VLIAEGDPIVRVVEDRLQPRPAGRNVAKQRPSQVRQVLSLAVAAGQQEDDHLVGQVLHRVLDGVGRDLVGLARVAHHEIGGEHGAPGGQHQTAAKVAVGVVILGDRYVRIGPDEVGRLQILVA
jgi:hypothetical protein